MRYEGSNNHEIKTVLYNDENNNNYYNVVYNSGIEDEEEENILRIKSKKKLK